MICASIHSIYTKKKITPFDYFSMPLLKKVQNKEESTQQDEKFLWMIEKGLLNPNLEKNKEIVNSLIEKGLWHQEK